MTRPMSPEREKEYAELSAYINFFATFTLGISPSDPSHPSNARIAERFGRSQALQGARQAANDSIAALRSRPVAEVRLLDTGLQEAGLITFSEVSRRYGRTYQRILKRGKIADETECYLVAGVLADLTAAVSETERAALQGLYEEFESAVSRRQP